MSGDLAHGVAKQQTMPHEFVDGPTEVSGELTSGHTNDDTNELTSGLPMDFMNGVAHERTEERTGNSLRHELTNVACSGLANDITHERANERTSA